MFVGKEIGPFLVDKELGAGAMGAVYRGRHKESKQKVAIKVIAPGLAASDAAMTRFKREIAILKQLEHPNIVRLVASGKLHGTPFYVMEYVEGESLDRVMERRGRITWEELVPLGQQLCAALQYAHDKGIIHRDLKPSNLMVLKDGTVKLTDFGIAKDTDVTALTAANSTVGTAAYMSPEQCRGARDLTHKSDLYSLGVMFYELTTGRKPFHGDSVMEMFNQHLTGSFERPSRLVLEIPIWLDTLICQLMEKEPDKRPFSAEMVSQSLGMIKDKVEAQQSAGIDAAKKRKIDKTSVEEDLSEADKEAARTLLGKKKKKKKVQFYRKGWFTVTAVGAILAAMGFVFYLVFIKIPSAESYYQQAKQGMENAKSLDDRLAVRKGPIEDFLTYYQDHEKAGKIRAWADQVDLEDQDRALHNRRGAMKARDEGESLARDALDYEDLGKLDDAAVLWKQLEKFKNKATADERAWGLLGGKYLKEIKDVDVLLAELQKKIDLEKAEEKKLVGETKAERLALEAVRKEEPAQAAAVWNELKTIVKDEPENRRWYLLAAKMHRELREKKP